MPDSDQPVFASTSLPRHLTRGFIGFGLIGSALALTPSVGPVALLLAPPGMVALRGCPMCWIAGLVETVSAGRVKRTCTDTGCTLSSSAPEAVTDEHAQRMRELSDRATREQAQNTSSTQ
jgi:hypothetical protein